ncbi:MAG: alpha/beta hydrolase [Alphaproteobacteria bacterium]
MSEIQFLPLPGGERLAYRRTLGKGPNVFWLSGFKSDMSGTKASHLADWARTEARGFLAFDYFGHGASSGDFLEGTIGRWKADTLAAFDDLTEGPQVLVGSSMGGWIALLLALARPESVHGLVLVAPAPDFTEDLIFERATPEMRAAWDTAGVWHRPSAYGQPYPITRRLIEEARGHLLLRAPIGVRAPVYILHGMKDADIPYRRSLMLAEKLESDRVLVEFSKSGDHRLSNSRDLERLTRAVQAMAEG